MLRYEACPYSLFLYATRIRVGERHSGTWDGPRSIFAFVGTVLHNAIEHALNNRTHDHVPINLIHPTALALFDEGVRERNFIEEQAEGREGQEVPFRELISAQRARISKLCLEFSRIWRDRGFASMEIITFEELWAIPWNETVELRGSIDLLLQDSNGTYHIIDWKSGALPNSPMQLQLYSVLLRRRLSVPFDSIIKMNVSLSEGSGYPSPGKQRDEKAVRRRIDRLMSNLMAMEDVESCSGQLTSYAAPSDANCSYCHERERCQVSWVG
jgi:hypothetical protein